MRGVVSTAGSIATGHPDGSAVLIDAEAALNRVLYSACGRGSASESGDHGTGDVLSGPDHQLRRNAAASQVRELEERDRVETARVGSWFRQWRHPTDTILFPE